MEERIRIKDGWILSYTVFTLRYPWTIYLPYCLRRNSVPITVQYDKNNWIESAYCETKRSTNENLHALARNKKNAQFMCKYLGCYLRFLLFLNFRDFLTPVFVMRKRFSVPFCGKIRGFLEDINKNITKNSQCKNNGFTFHVRASIYIGRKCQDFLDTVFLPLEILLTILKLVHNKVCPYHCLFLRFKPLLSNTKQIF